MRMKSSAAPLQTSKIVARIGAGVLGGYAFVWGFISLVCALGAAAGMHFDDARTLAYLLAFIVYLIVFCWAFADAKLARVWAVLAGGGLLMTGVAWFVGQAIS